MKEHTLHVLSPSRGEANENPTGISLPELIVEDFRTHDRDIWEPGFWAIAAHRFGNARMSVRRKIFRAPLTAIYRSVSTSINWWFGIDLPYTVKLGRRVRIWHHGGIVVIAHRIGDDVHIRHNTTFGVARRSEPWARPIIGDRVDIGVGTCILGAVTVGDDSVIGAGSIVVRDIPAGATAVGAPARVIRSAEDDARETRESGFRFRAVSPEVVGRRRA